MILLFVLMFVERIWKLVGVVCLLLMWMFLVNGNRFCLVGIFLIFVM